MDKHARDWKWVENLSSGVRNHKITAGIMTALTSFLAGKYAYKGGKAWGAHTGSRNAGRVEFGNVSDPWAKGSYWNTINPFSGITGGVDKVPGWYRKLFPEGEFGDHASHITFKTGAVSLLAAGLVGNYRVLKHYGEMEDLEDADRPGKNLASQLSTTFAGALGSSKKRKATKKASLEKSADPKDVGNSRVDLPDPTSMVNMLGTAVPLGAALLAAATTYHLTDKYFDKQRSDALDKSIASKDKAIKDLIAARARIAKGTETKSDVGLVMHDGAPSSYVKKATVTKKGFTTEQLTQSFGLLTAATVLASAIGSYAYTAAGDENNLKYKAYKQALKEYAKNKSGITPITIVPSDSQRYFSSIDNDKNSERKKTPRDQPAIDTDDLNKPISITI